MIVSKNRPEFYSLSWKSSCLLPRQQRTRTEFVIDGCRSGLLQIEIQGAQRILEENNYSIHVAILELLGVTRRNLTMLKVLLASS